MKQHVKSLQFVDSDRQATLAFLCREMNNYLRPRDTDKVCVDIGANVGAFTHTYQNSFEQIFCFEPGYGTYLWLLETIKNIDHAKAFNLAVGSQIGTIDLKTCKEGPTQASYNASTYPDEEHYYTPEYERCLTVDLNTVFKLIDEDYIDYMKIDCEASEYDFLIDQDLSQIGSITMELHRQLGTEKCTLLLDQLKSEFSVRHVAREDVPISGAGHATLSFER